MQNKLRIPFRIVFHLKSHRSQLCFEQDRVVEGIVATQTLVKFYDDVRDSVSAHGLGHILRGCVPPVLLALPSAVLEVVNILGLGYSAPPRVSQLKTVDGRNKVSQGFSGVNVLLTSRPETGPKHRRFARSEHVIKEDVLPLLQSEASPFWPCRTMVSTSACSRCFLYKTSRGLLPKVSSSLVHSCHSCRGSSPTIPTGKAQEKAE